MIVSKTARTALLILGFSMLHCAGLTTAGGTAAAPLRLYEGAPRPRNEVAIVQSDGGTSLRISEIDGRKGPNSLGYGNAWDGAFYLELLPGPHTFSLGLVVSSGGSVLYSQHDLVKTFTLEPGHNYILELGAPEAGAGWGVGLKDAAK